MTRARRLLYGAAIAVVGLVLLEGVAWAVERALPPLTPDPSPGEQERFRRHTDVARRSLPRLKHAPTPLPRDPAAGWTLPRGGEVPSGPELAHLNAHGLRSAPLTERSAGTEHLLTLGDSSIFGDAVADDQVLDQVAARGLSGRWGVAVRGINGGVPGYSSLQALERLRAVGPAVQPTLVVIGTLWSDVYAAGAKGAPPPRGEVGVRALASWRLLRRALAPMLPQGRVGWVASVEDIGAVDGGTRTPLPTYVATLHALASASRALGATPVFLALPAPIDLDARGAPVTVQAFRAAMAEVARDEGAPFVDGPAYFRAHGGTVGHFVDQVHPDAHGHALLGAALVDALAGLPHGSAPAGGPVPPPPAG